MREIPATRAAPAARNTHSVPALRGLVEDAIHAAFPHRVWVAGEVGPVGRDADGALRFPLLSAEGDEGLRLACLIRADAEPALRATLLRVHDAAVEDILTPGRAARVGGLLRYDFAHDTLTLAVSELDPAPTASGLAHERAQALALVNAADLAQHQRERVLPVAPLRVALVGFVGDGAVARVAASLGASPYAVRTDVVPVPPHRPSAATDLASAVTRAARGNDLVLLVREEGRPLALGVFDSLEVAEAIAAAPVPVITGLGGRGERTAADSVAFTAVPTAEAAAEAVLARLARAERALHRLEAEVNAAADAATDRAVADLRAVRAAVDTALQRAQARAEAAERRWRLRLIGLAGFLAAVIVLVAVLTARPEVLLGLLLIGGALLAGRQWSTRERTRGSRLMDLQTTDFAAVLERLNGVRDELDRTSNPEKVYRLRDFAAQLVDRGEHILGRHLEPATPQPAAEVAPEESTTALAPHAGPDDAPTTALPMRPDAPRPSAL